MVRLRMQVPVMYCFSRQAGQMARGPRSKRYTVICGVSKILQLLEECEGTDYRTLEKPRVGTLQELGCACFDECESSLLCRQPLQNAKL